MSSAQNLTNVIESRDGFLFRRTSPFVEHPGVLGECGPSTKCQFDLCRDHGTRSVTFLDINTPLIFWMIDVREVDRDTLEPILFLLQSADVEVQRAASAALGNLAVNSKFIASCV